MRAFRLGALLLALLTLLGGCALPVSESAPAPEFYELNLVTDPPAPESAGEKTAPPAEADALSEDGSYSSPEDVAAYLVRYGHLPGNYITKAEAQDLGWDSARGNLWTVAPGKSIGGDRFGNYEGLLPKGGSYRECDVNYTGGYRGAERLIYDGKGGVWYTADHYQSFTRLY
ncbi:MAG: ribonuclease [Oscillospiraceae bacterium]|nr:ribonuclease [Oscillospiraceae bacterium]